MKYIIKFSPEYLATSLWPANDFARVTFGIPIKYSEIGLSDGLVTALEQFDESIMGIIDWSNPGGKSPLSINERRAIYSEGKRLYSLVKEELITDFEVWDCLEWLDPQEGEKD